MISAYGKMLKKVNVYGVMFVMFAGAVAVILGAVSLLLMTDMLGIALF
jgi:hypothetical protein